MVKCHEVKRKLHEDNAQGKIAERSIDTWNVKESGIEQRLL